jgi:hypothetical protein
MISTRDYYDKGMDMSDLENGKPSNNFGLRCIKCQERLTKEDELYSQKLCQDCNLELHGEQNGEI